MFCGNCGKEMQENAKACTACGALLEEYVVDTPVAEKSVEKVETVATPVVEKKEPVKVVKKTIVKTTPVKQVAAEKVAPVKKTNVFSILGLVAAILGVFFGDNFLLLPNVLGAVFGAIGVAKAKSCGKGKGMGIAAIILSVLSILWNILLGILSVVIVVIVLIAALLPEIL